MSVCRQEETPTRRYVLRLQRSQPVGETRRLADLPEVVVEGLESLSAAASLRSAAGAAPAESSSPVSSSPSLPDGRN